jgi:hypothetical protein
VTCVVALDQFDVYINVCCFIIFDHCCHFVCGSRVSLSHLFHCISTHEYLHWFQWILVNKICCIDIDAISIYYVWLVLSLWINSCSLLLIIVAILIFLWISYIFLASLSLYRYPWNHWFQWILVNKICCIDIDAISIYRMWLVLSSSL